jgi:hypothetical protein
LRNGICPNTVRHWDKNEEKKEQIRTLEREKNVNVIATCAWWKFFLSSNDVIYTASLTCLYILLKNYLLNILINFVDDSCHLCMNCIIKRRNNEFNACNLNFLFGWFMFFVPICHVMFL